MTVPSWERSHSAVQELVNDAGNPWVFSAVPVPVPAKYPYPPHGYGFDHGYAYNTHGLPVPILFAGNPRVFYVYI